MSEFVKGKNIMITGATSGIGLELVKSFSSKGANIIMLGKDEDKLDELYDDISTQRGKNLIVRSDLKQLDEKSVIQISDEIKKYYENIDGLIHNAAILGNLTRIEDYQSKIWDDVLQVNLTSSFLITKHLMELISYSNEARIIFVYNMYLYICTNHVNIHVCNLKYNREFRLTLFSRSFPLPARRKSKCLLHSWHF